MIKSIWPSIELFTGWNPVKQNKVIKIFMPAPIRMINCRCVISFDLKNKEDKNEK